MWDKISAFTIATKIIDYALKDQKYDNFELNKGRLLAKTRSAIDYYKQNNGNIKGIRLQIRGFLRSFNESYPNVEDEDIINATENLNEILNGTLPLEN